MSKEEIRRQVDLGFEKDRQAKVLLKELEEIKDRLKKAAAGEKVTFVGTGCQAVCGVGRKMVSRIEDPLLLKRLRKFCGDHFPALFKFAPCGKFEAVAEACLGPVKGAELAGGLKGAPYQTCEFSEVK